MKADFIPIILVSYKAYSYGRNQVDFGPPMSFSAATAESCTLDHVFRFKGHPYAALRIHKTKA